MSHSPQPNAEPGTGTQIKTIATPPEILPGGDNELPSSKRINGTKWKVGHDYIDTEIGDVCTLTKIIKRSAWCDTGDIDDNPLELVFEYERYDNFVRAKPESESFDDEQFMERYTPDQPVGAPSPPW